MRRGETKNSCSFRYSFNMMIDFCIWVLEKDGLQVPPFNAHTGGDGILQNQGFQVEEWKQWTDKVVQLQHQQFIALSQQIKLAQEHASFILPDAYNPPANWVGSDLIRNHLDELWEEYKPLSDDRSLWKRSLSKQLSTVTSSIWNDLQIYNTRLPALTIYFVEYPQQVEYLISPVSAIMTIVDGKLDNELFRYRISQVAERLVV